MCIIYASQLATCASKGYDGWYPNLAMGLDIHRHNTPCGTLMALVYDSQLNPEQNISDLLLWYQYIPHRTSTNRTNVLLPSRISAH